MSKEDVRNGVIQQGKGPDNKQILSNGKSATYSQDSDNEKETNKSDQGLPVDRGWAWVVLGAATFYFFLFGGVRKNFGLFFVAFQKRFNSSASVTSLLTTVQSTTISISALIVMTVGLHFLSCRTSIMIGGALIAAANIINGLSTEIGIVFASFGIIEAIGISMVHPPVTSMLGEYFNRKRGMANALAFSGASLGSLVFAPVMSSLFETYGYTGTMFVVAGITLNTCVSGALMRPISSFTNTKKSDSIDEKETEPILKDNEVEEPLSITISSDKHEFSSLEIMPIRMSELRNDTALLFRQHSYDPKRDPSGLPLVPRQRTWSATAQPPRNRTVSENEHHRHLHGFIESLSRSKVSLYASTSGFCGSIVDVRKSVERTLSQTEDTEESLGQSCCVSCKNSVVKVFRLLFDFTLIKNPVFLTFMMMALLVHGGTALTLFLIPPHAKDIGLSSDQIGILLSIVGCFDLIGRITLAIISDRKFVKRTTILGCSLGIVGLSSQFLRFFSSFGSMVFFSVITGSFCGLYQALHAVILVDYLTLPKLKSCLGFAILCHGISMSVFFPIAGTIRDNTGTYVNSYHLLGCILLIGSVIAFCLPYVYRNSTKAKEQSELNS